MMKNIKASSTPASPAFKGQETEHPTVNWLIVLRNDVFSRFKELKDGSLSTEVASNVHRINNSIRLSLSFPRSVSRSVTNRRLGVLTIYKKHPVGNFRHKQ